MMRRSILLLVAVFFFGVISTRANDVYIAQSGTGNANGADCADALPYTYFNSSGNWTSGTPSGTQIGPGTTVHICGTITGSTGANILSFQKSGTSGNPITLFWESGASISSPACPTASSGCIVNNQSYIVINGNGTTNSIVNTANGTSGSYANQVNSVGVFNGGNNVTIENLDIEGMYIRTSNTDTAGTGSYAIDNGTVSNLTVTGNTCNNSSACFYWSLGTASNITFSNNILNNFNHGIQMGNTATNVTAQNIYIFGNHFINMATWDYPPVTSCNAGHHDGIFLYDATLGQSSFYDVYIYNNYFGVDSGSDIGVCATAWFYHSTGIVTGYLFNNVFMNPTARNATQYEFGCTQCTNWNVFNNYFYQNPSSTGYFTINNGSSAQAAGYSMENNVIDGASSTGGAGYESLNQTPTTVNVMNYNVFSPTGAEWQQGSTYYPTLSAWQAASGEGTHSFVTSNTNVNSSGVPQSGSPLIGAGANLTSICSGQPNPGLGALCYDFNGNPRPSSGNWDIGAYVAGSTGTTGTTVAPPTGLTATVQ